MKCFEFFRGESKLETVVNACLALALLAIGVPLFGVMIMIHPPLGGSATAAIAILLSRRILGRTVAGIAVAALGLGLLSVAILGDETWDPAADKIDYALWVGGMRRDPCGPRELELLVSIAFLLGGGYMCASEIFRRKRRRDAGSAEGENIVL